MTTGVPASSSTPQTSASSGSRTSNAPTCTCTLKISAPAASRAATYVRGAGLGIEGRAAQAAGRPVGEPERPVVEELRHPRPVGVGQRREPAYAEAAQGRDQLLVGAAVLAAATAGRSADRRCRTARAPWPSPAAAGSACARRTARAAREAPWSRSSTDDVDGRHSGLTRIRVGPLQSMRCSSFIAHEPDGEVELACPGIPLVLVGRPDRVHLEEPHPRPGGRPRRRRPAADRCPGGAGHGVRRAGAARGTAGSARSSSATPDHRRRPVDRQVRRQPSQRPRRTRRWPRGSRTTPAPPARISQTAAGSARRTTSTGISRCGPWPGARSPAASRARPGARRARAACRRTSCPWPARSRPWRGRP